MSTLHKAFGVDEAALANLPTGSSKEERLERRKLFRQADGNGNGILSLAEADNMVKKLLHVEGMQKLKPVIDRSFHAARDIVPPVGDFSPHYVDFYEFRFFLLYLRHYLEVWKIFASLQIGPEGLKDNSGRKADGRFDHDRRLSYAEFEKGLPILLKWPKLHPAIKTRLRKDPAKVWREDIDDNEGGIVLFDEFAHWLLYCEIFTTDELEGDANDDEEMQEALDILKKQKPNLCGKDLASIRAAKAKYRVDAPIHGQGCLTRDHMGRLEVFGGGLDGDSAAQDKWLRKGKAAAELVKGGNYAGGLADWEAKQRRGAWKGSMTRCENEAKRYHKRGKNKGLCENGCGRPAFGRFDTCCSHCKGAEGPHARDCFCKNGVSAGLKPPPFQRTKSGMPMLCKNRCGRAAYGKFDTCCTACTGREGQHKHDCWDKSNQAFQFCMPCGSSTASAASSISSLSIS